MIQTEDIEHGITRTLLIRPSPRGAQAGLVLRVPRVAGAADVLAGLRVRRGRVVQVVGVLRRPHSRRRILPALGGRQGCNSIDLFYVPESVPKPVPKPVPSDVWILKTCQNF